MFATLLTTHAILSLYTVASNNEASNSSFHTHSPSSCRSRSQPQLPSPPSRAPLTSTAATDARCGMGIHVQLLRGLYQVVQLTGLGWPPKYAPARSARGVQVDNTLDARYQGHSYHVVLGVWRSHRCMRRDGKICAGRGRGVFGRIRLEGSGEREMMSRDTGCAMLWWALAVRERVVGMCL